MAASLAFQSDPAAVVQSHVARAMTTYWQNEPATAKRHTWLALLLVEAADNPSIQIGASLGSLRDLYGDPA